jgi:Ca-activated chloride channel family protein
MSNQQSNYYEILGLKRDASTREVEEAFVQLRSRLSETGEDPGESDFAIIVHAYEVLSSSHRRRLYDSLLAETDKPPLVTNIQSSSQQIQVLDIPQIVYLLVELRSPEMVDNALLPLNLCLVIDRSTSMRGERQEQVKVALQMLLNKLSPGDVLSIVSFSDRAEIILPAMPVGEHQEPMAKIQDIQVAGGTEIYQGLTAGVQQMRQVALSNYNNHLILLTDGHTYGDAAQCLRLAAREADEGITINAFGIGTDWDDQFLDALVAPSGGCAEYVDSPQTIVSVLESRLQGLGEAFARRVRLQENWPRRVDLLDAFRLTPYAKPLLTGQDGIRLGDIEGRSPLTFLLEFSIEPHPIPARIRIPLAFEAEIPGQEKQVFEALFQLTILNDAIPADSPPDVIRAVRLLTFYRLNEKAWQEIELGQVDKAATRMHHLSTRFLEIGESRLAQQADIEARRLSVSGKLSAEGRKQLKYGTRTLMGKTLQLEWDDSL